MRTTSVSSIFGAIAILLSPIAAFGQANLIGFSGHPEPVTILVVGFTPQSAISAGTITHIQYYLAVNDPGREHVATLWKGTSGASLPADCSSQTGLLPADYGATALVSAAPLGTLITVPVLGTECGYEVGERIEIRTSDGGLNPQAAPDNLNTWWKAFDGDPRLASNLIDRGNGLIYDAAQNITWLQDANFAQTSGYDSDGRMTWDEAVIWADQLAYQGFDDWRLPSTPQPDSSCSDQLDPGNGFPLQSGGQGCIGSEMGHLNNVDGVTLTSPDPFTNVQSAVLSIDYWSGTEYAPGPANAWIYNLAGSFQGINPKTGSTPQLNVAWAVRDGDVLGGPSPIQIIGYDVVNADVSGTGGWAHEYTGTITPTTGSLANYSGGTGTMADGVFLDTTVLNTQSFWSASTDVAITLYFDKAYTVSDIYIYGGPNQNNVLPGLIDGFDITLNGTTRTLATTGFGAIGATGRPVNDRADLVSAGVSNIAVSSITISNISEDLGQGAISIAEIFLYGNADLPNPSPDFSITPDMLDFGAVSLGGSSERTATIQNLSQEAITVTASSSEPFSILSGTSYPLEIGESAIVDLAFSPSIPGLQDGSLDVSTLAQNVAVELTGEGLAATQPAIILSATDLNFGSIDTGDTSESSEVTVTNVGDANLLISSIDLSGDVGEFIIDAATCALADIPPAGTCSFFVQFSPLAVGPRSATATILSNATNGSAQVDLLGTGLETIPTLIVNGKTLHGTQEKWVRFVGENIVSTLPGSRENQLLLSSRASWWALKEGLFSLSKPIQFSLCSTLEKNGKARDVRLKVYEICEPFRAWQVGLAGVQVPNFTDATVLALVESLWPGRATLDVLSEVAELAGIDPLRGDGQVIVNSQNVLRKSWLMRHPTVGLTLVEQNVTAECIVEPVPNWCFGGAWKSARDFAATREEALQSIEDLRAIYDSLYR